MLGLCLRRNPLKFLYQILFLDQLTGKFLNKIQIGISPEEYLYPGLGGKVAHDWISGLL